MSDHEPRDPAKLQRQRRLEEQLRQNLMRRKAQARSRRSAPDEGLDKSAHPAADAFDPGDTDD